MEFSIKMGIRKMEDSVLQTRLLVSQGNSFGNETCWAGKLPGLILEIEGSV